MVFSKSRLPIFIFCSLIAHLAIIAIPMKTEYDRAHSPKIGIIFNRETKEEVKVKADKVPPKAKSKTVAESVVVSETKSIRSEVVQESVSSAEIETAKNKYLRLVTQSINKIKRYPRKAQALNQEGTVLVSLKLDINGKVLDLKVLKESRFVSLTDATIEAIKSVEKFPIIPTEMNLNEITLIIPVEYVIQM